MTITHTNPTNARKNRDYQDVWARAPYNFVSLPPLVVNANPPLHLDTFADGISGRIHCKLTTKSPTYVRGMLNLLDYKDIRDKQAKDLTEGDKTKLSDFFHKTDPTKPCLPGSSLRGMLRSLVEIISYSRVRWVAPDQAFFFRSVAAQRGDPLSQDYQVVRNPQAGFLFEHNHRWRIRPALSPSTAFHSDYKYFQIENDLAARVCDELQNFRDVTFNNPPASPKKLPYLEVMFDAVATTEIEVQRRKGREVTIEIKKNRVTKVGLPKEQPPYTVFKYDARQEIASEQVDSRLPFTGWILAGGNMLESSPAGTRSRRRFHPVVLSPNPTLQIDQCPRFDAQAVSDYLDNLTEFQKERLGPHGALVSGRPVFYVQPQPGQDVVYFGHSPNFRVPARTDGWVGQSADSKNRASNIADFLPGSALGGTDPDLADVIFGWTEEYLKINRAVVRQIGPKGYYKGRVTMSDARCLSEGDLFVEEPRQSPKILASPKPSAFQNYLAQDAGKGHNPDNLANLAHYGTKPDETVIRGTKRYWPRGKDPAFRESPEVVSAHKERYTRIKAIKPEKEFEFEIHFSQLREEELGALLWALKLPGEEGKTYHHRLGMGKPYGMGAVEIKPTLYIINRQERYQKIFSEDLSSWHTAETKQEKVVEDRYLGAFERFILDRVSPGTGKLIDLYRMKELMTMLEWRENPSAAWQDITQYQPLDDFRVRPVLPDPVCVAARANQNNIAGPCAANADQYPGAFQASQPVAKSERQDSDSVQPPSGVAAPGLFPALNQVVKANVDKIIRTGQQPGYLLKAVLYPECLFFLPIDSTNAYAHKVGAILNLKVGEERKLQNGASLYMCQELSV